MGKILVLVGPLTLYWHGIDNLKRMGHEVVVHSTIENGSGLEQIFSLVETEKPALVLVDGCFPLRAAAIGQALIERGIKCLPILERRDWTLRRWKSKEGAVVEGRPVIDRLCESLGDRFLAFNTRGDLCGRTGEIHDLLALEKFFSTEG